MILAVDVYYTENRAKVVGALFDWEDYEPQQIIVDYINEVSAYHSGQFYKRELPCILKLLEVVDLNQLQAIIIDGHCFINNNRAFGLGAYLWESLNGKVPVIGVAKNMFHNTEEVSFPIYRGESKKPLFVSSIGYDINKAKNKIGSMKGKFRMPNILKLVDQQSRVS